ncbi:hypothetical protein [Paraburkholderia sp. J12]|uniref:hypothetical protein n=1 Tax=Paraburkholderia sp. J12 TaxID=2805432 RepID=UPI002ABDC89F|nr:hypothetical protein [Paraburkholderia sp. J12]
MNIPALRAETNQSSYFPGDEFAFRILFDLPHVELAQLSNVTVNLNRVDVARNQFALSFGATPHVQGNIASIIQNLPQDLRPGIYVIDAVNLRWDSACEIIQPQSVAIGPIFFAIRSLGEAAIGLDQLAESVRGLQLQRWAYTTREIHTQACVGQGTGVPYRVLVFGVGCLIHAPQQLEGFSVTPLGRGFSHARLHEIVNTTLYKLGLGGIEFKDTVEAQYERSTPTFLIEYSRVLATDHVDALNHCRQHADLIFELLGLDRGHKPCEFYSMALDQNSGQQWSNSFGSPIYRGNLLPDADPASAANLIEVATPKLERTPFLRLLLRSYAEATSEADPGIALLRSWSVLELLADREISSGNPITYPDGKLILNRKGNPKDTNAKEARVYQLIMNSNPLVQSMTRTVDGREQHLLLGGDKHSPSYTPNTIILSVWDVVRAAYAIRNCVAHEGYFSEREIDPDNEDQILAAHLILDTPLDPRRWVRDTAELAVLQKLRSV